VLVLEQRAKVGQYVVCAGVVGVEAFKRFDLPPECILHHLKSLCVYSPSGTTLRYLPGGTFAYLTDRRQLNQLLQQRAETAGAEIRLASRVERLTITDAGVTVGLADDAGETAVHAQVVVLATGPGFGLHRAAGLGRARAYLHGAQTEAVLQTMDETAVYLGRPLSTGTFAWVIPSVDHRGRIGVLGRGNARQQLQAFLQERIAAQVQEPDRPIRQKRMVRQFQGTVAANRAVAVGEAAGHVKPTSGGGIFYGLLCADILAEVLHDACRHRNFSQTRLQDYASRCQAELGTELKMGLYLRRVWRTLRDQDIDRIFRLVRSSIGPHIDGSVDFEYHSGFIARGLRLIRQQLPRLLNQG